MEEHAEKVKTVRVQILQAVAKCIAYNNCGKPEKATEWANHLVALLESIGIEVTGSKVTQMINNGFLTDSLIKTVNYQTVDHQTIETMQPASFKRGSIPQIIL
jgi:hypothetical protein